MRDYYTTVRAILIENPDTRDDDMLLYGAFLAKYMIVHPSEYFYDVLRTAKQRKLPSYESITRARRRIQEKEPLLQGKLRSERMEKQEIYHDYYSKK